MNKNRWIPVVASVFLLLFSLTSFAFEDISDEAGKDAILELYNNGYVNGISKTKFAPQRSLTYAEAVTLYVKVFDLNLDHISFMKEPLASDAYDNIKNDAWYADAFVIAFHNGVTFSREIDPMSVISKEEFAHHLHQILTSKIKIAVIMMQHHYADIDEVDPSYRSSINNLISLKIVTLDKDNQFQPKKAISRVEASVMLHNMLEKYEDQLKKPIVIPPKPPIKIAEVEVFTEKVTDEVNKVTVYWGEQGSPGYYVTIDSITFNNTTATIYYSLHYPKPNQVYPTVMVTAKAFTYVDAKYMIETVQNNTYNLPYEIPKVQTPITKPNNK